MNPVTIGAVLLAITSGAAGEAGSKLWDAIAALVRRPFGSQQTKHTAESISSGTAELAALEAAPHDGERAVALAQVLLARSAADSRFSRELEAWWAQTKFLTGDGSVTNTITGGVHHGPVFQGRDFSNISFGTPPSDGSAS